MWPVLALGAADPFAGWEGRWSIEIEETTPAPLEISAETNWSFRTRALQVHAVLACGAPDPFGKDSADVTCKFEALSLHATPRADDVSDTMLENNHRVLVDMVRRLQPATLVLTVTSDGRLTALDLKDLPADDRRELESREDLRRIAFDVVAGLHLRRPAEWSAGWLEKNSLLLRAPTQPASTGKSKTTHVVSQVEGATVVQSTGEGTFTAPFEPMQFAYEGKTVVTRGAAGGVSGGAGGGFGAAAPLSATASNEGQTSFAGATPPATAPTDRVFAGTLTSVAVVDETGPPVERVWALVGRPTASSIGNMQGWSIWYAGRARKLGPNEAVDVGETKVVAPPGTEIPGLSPWEPLETF